MARKLRIAATVFFGALTLLLIALWGRKLEISRNDYAHTEVGVINGYAFVVHSNTPFAIDPGHLRQGWWFGAGRDRAIIAKFRWTRGVDGTTVTVPLWFITLLSAAATVLPCLPIRFSLRTLLIVTALFAVVLGLAVWGGL